MSIKKFLNTTIILAFAVGICLPAWISCGPISFFGLYPFFIALVHFDLGRVFTALADD